MLFANRVTAIYRIQCCGRCINGLKSDRARDADKGDAALPSVQYLGNVRMQGFDEQLLCGKYFNSGGGCCDQKQLVAHANVWKQRLRSRFNEFSDISATYQAIAKRINEVISYIVSKKSEIEGKIKALPLDPNMYIPEPVSSTNPYPPQEGTQSTEVPSVGVQQDVPPTDQGNETNQSEPVDPMVGPGESEGNVGGAKGQATNGNEGNLSILDNYDYPLPGTDPELPADKVKVEDLLKILEEYKSIKEEDIKARYLNSKKQLDDCYSAIVDLRMKGLCLRCSPAAFNIFNPERGTYMIDSNICVDLLTKCGAVYGVLVEANRLFETINTLKYIVDTNGVPNRVRRFMIGASKVKSWIACANNPSKCGSRTDILNMCSDFTLSLESPVEDITRAKSAEAIKTTRRLLGENGESSVTSNEVVTNSGAVSEDPIEEGYDGYGFIDPLSSSIPYSYPGSSVNGAQPQIETMAAVSMGVGFDLSNLESGDSPNQTTFNYQKINLMVWVYLTSILIAFN